MSDTLLSTLDVPYALHSVGCYGTAFLVPAVGANEHVLKAQYLRIRDLI